jgi:rhomboid protease GluP
MDPQPLIPTSVREPAPAPASFTVYFTNPGLGAGIGSRPQPYWKLAGKGELTVDGTILTLRGRRHRSFLPASNQEVSVRLSDVINVVRDGRCVQCHVRILDANTLLRMWAVDERSAEQIVALLPKERTPEFEEILAEQDSFKLALQAINARSVVTPALVIVNCLVFAYTVFEGGGLMTPDGPLLVTLGTNYGPFTLDGQWWRLFTAMFLHFGMIHLLLNMVGLWAMGQIAERLYGSVYFLVLYVLAGLYGSVASLIWHPELNSAGASGAIFGVLGGLLAFMLNPRTRVPPSVAAPQRNSALIFVAYNLLNGFAHTGIDNAAHIGGLVGGLIIGWFLARPLEVKARENPAPRLLGVTLGALAALAGVSWSVLHPNATLAAERHFRHECMLFDRDEARLLALERSLGADHKISSREWGQRMATEVLPAWQRAEERVLATELPPESRLYPYRTKLIAYIDELRHALQLLSDAARYDDNEKLLLGRQIIQQQERKRAELDQLLESYYQDRK